MVGEDRHDGIRKSTLLTLQCPESAHKLEAVFFGKRSSIDIGNFNDQKSLLFKEINVFFF